MTTQTLTPKMSALISLANSQRIGAEYQALSRNPDAAVRAQFKADREIVGTRAWAIARCMTLSSTNYDDDTCDAIMAALNS